LKTHHNKITPSPPQQLHDNSSIRTPLPPSPTTITITNTVPKWNHSNNMTGAQAIAIEDGRVHPLRGGNHTAKYFDILRQQRALIDCQHQWVIYNNFQYSGKQYIQTVTAVDPTSLIVRASDSN
jgi:hypothetical protein